MGVSGSVIERMARHGGEAHIDGEPGAGTPVTLTLPADGSGAGGRDERASGAAPAIGASEEPPQHP
jgi:signal transduction histidine kinase